MTDQTKSEAVPICLEECGWKEHTHAQGCPVPIAIRALEAKVREAESEHAGVVATLGKALRDLSFAAQTTGGTAGRDEGLVAAIDGATQALSLIGVSRSIDLVSDLRADRDRLAGEVQAERETSARLRGHMFVMEQEDARLTAELAAARVNEAWWQRAVADAYGWLWCVNEEPGTPNRFPAERAAYNARKLLRELLTHEQRGIGINRAVIQRDAARRAGEGEK